MSSEDEEDGVEVKLFDRLSESALDLVKVAAMAKSYSFTDQEMENLKVGIAAGIHATCEHFRSTRKP